MTDLSIVVAPEQRLVVFRQRPNFRSTEKYDVDELIAERDKLKRQLADAKKLLREVLQEWVTT